ncbi:MAG: hypothetical protein ACLVAA_03100 [Ruthenibacterium sp.]
MPQPMKMAVANFPASGRLRQPFFHINDRKSRQPKCRNITEQEKRGFQKVIAVCVAGAILILLVPLIFHTVLIKAIN